MAKKKVKSIEVDFKHLGISTAITVGLAEIVPAAFFAVTALWQVKFYESMTAGGFFGKASFTIDDVMSFGNYMTALGAILTIGILIYLSILLVDEYLFSHRLESIGSVALYGFVWAAGYYFVDSLILALSANRQFQWPSTSGIYLGGSLIVAIVIFAIPFAIYFARKYAKRK